MKRSFLIVGGSSDIGLLLGKNILENGDNLTFSLANAVINNTDLMLFVNGLLQLSGAALDYTLTGSEINFNSGLAPLSDDTITAIYRPST